MSSSISDLPNISSPSLLTVSSTPYYIVPSRSPTSSYTTPRVLSDDSDDEIVWRLSQSSISATSARADGTFSGEDFVVLRQALPSDASTAAASQQGVIELRTGTPLTHDLNTKNDHGNEPPSLSDNFSVPAGPPTGEKAPPLDIDSAGTRVRLSSYARKPRRHCKGRSSSHLKDPTSSPPHPPPRGSARRRGKAGHRASIEQKSELRQTPPPHQRSSHSDGSPPKSKSRAAEEGLSVGQKLTAPTFGSRPIVDDIESEVQSVVEEDGAQTPTLYEEASSFISSFLSNPRAKQDTVYRLALLQSLIIELGIDTPGLPTTLADARLILKTRVFMNIRDYLDVRAQGTEALQRVMYPNKSALIKDIKRKRNAASIEWVKQHGLQVLLVGWMYH